MLANYQIDETVHDLIIMSLAHNYSKWIISNFSSYIGKVIVEVGAGIGTYTQKLSEIGERVFAVDINPQCIHSINLMMLPNVTTYCISIDSNDFTRLKEFHPDTVICINVLEHIENDMVALSNIAQVLKPGGKLLLIVPAFQFLFSKIDRTVGHHRRYTKKTLTDKLQAFFEIDKLYYMNTTGVAGWFLNKLFGKSKQSTKQVVFYDRYIVPVVSSIENKIHPPFGLSLVGICTRK